uniref:Uncharacterized protein n=1 Tax=Utricularia reniformis TaxID=192314 RepID=A0A1Y0B182_9LAMI|nr:hypothetical protein AEK19_MT0921 [Utricularia reniformis]ART31147.1 hypothetical protein AEK19_MT0921 [Utricularia reniformis]
MISAYKNKISHWKCLDSRFIIKMSRRFLKRLRVSSFALP